MILYQFVRNYKWNVRIENFKFRRDEIVDNVFFKYKNEKNFDNYCKTKLMLHHFFRDVENLKIVDDVIYEIWQNVYQIYHDNHVEFHDRDSLNEYRLFQNDDSNMKSLINNEKNFIEIETHEKFLAFRKFDRDDRNVEIDFDLRRRSMNRQHDWFRKSYDIDFFRIAKNFEIMCRHKSMFDLMFESFIDAKNFDQLNVKQREIFDLYVNVYFEECTNQLFIHLNDVADTDKFRVIDMLSRFLIYHVNQKDEKCSEFTILRSAFIDVIAHNIDDFTLHFLFRFFVRREMINLNKTKLI